MSINTTPQVPAHPELIDAKELPRWNRPAFNVVPVEKRAPAKPKAKKRKPEPHTVEHVRYGVGTLLGIRQLGDGNYAASVDFGDGTTRIIRLDQAYWISPISDLVPVPPMASRPKPMPVTPVHEDNDASTTRDGDGQDADSSEAA